MGAIWGMDQLFSVYDLFTVCVFKVLLEHAILLVLNHRQLLISHVLRAELVEAFASLFGRI